MQNQNSSLRGRYRADGFTLIELLVVIAIIALLIGILLPALGGAISSSRTLKCQVNMRSMGQAAMTYSGDYRDAIPAFNWKPGSYDTPYDDLRGASNDRETSRYQAVSLIRDFVGNPFIPRASGGNNWFSNLWFSHLVYVDYLSGNLEEPTAACPEDDQQVERAETPSSDYATNQLYRKFESSYETSIVAYSVDRMTNSLSPIEQHNENWSTFNRAPSYIDTRKYTEVVFTSGKAHMFDTFDRHFAEEPDYFFFEPNARQPILFFDGSVSVENTNDANPGYQPLDPTGDDPTLIRASSSAEFYPGYYRWTRGGLRGIDFGGSEIWTGQSRP